MEPEIRVEHLSKKYRIGARDNGYRTFREAVVVTVAAPFHRLRRTEITPVPAETIWALKDVSFEVRQGEVVGIIGRNGAGKSTLLKILSRITEPTEGKVELRGRVASLLEVGTGFHPELTGRENLYLNGAILGMKKAEIKRKFDEIVAFAEVEKFIDTPVKHYSSGMYVRLAFAVAAHLESEILIVDEVLAVGDAAFQRKCLGKMGEIGRAGRTVLLVSHNMASIVELCDYAIWIDNAQIRVVTDPEKAVQSYLTSGLSVSDGIVVFDEPERRPSSVRWN
jgi:lipopolysaccharide transport system ATP-binding protein